MSQLIGQKKLVLCCTTGRSGTQYLSSLLESVPGVESVHEASPGFESVMRAGQADTEIIRTFLNEQKFPAIRASSKPIYAESSHLACKGFIQEMIPMGVVPDLIILRREPRAVAYSLYQIETIPGETDSGLQWLLAPGDPGTLPIPAIDPHPYQLCYWYCLETERRALLLESLVLSNGGRVTSTTIDKLKSPEGLSTICRDLDLPKLGVWGRAANGLRRRIPRNSKSKQKKAKARNALTQEERCKMEIEVLRACGFPQA